MRSLPAGFILLALSSVCFAQVRGEVESIGFGGQGFYRPECWTPMVVRLDSQSDDVGEYRIEVHQRDLDFDHVVYVKDGITLNPHATQRWEVCFLPEPTSGGLPDNNIAELQKRLLVYLTSKSGKQLLQLPITSSVSTLEMPASGFNRPKGQKLVLYVADGNSRISVADYQDAIGLDEQPNFVRVQSARQFPQSVLAYQAVDAVLWVRGDARVLSEQGSKQLLALHQWVKEGGMLVICQPPSNGERQLIAPFADMLPIQWQDNGAWKVSIQDKEDLDPLPTLTPLHHPNPNKKIWNVKGPFPFARAMAKRNAVVDATIDWKDGKEPTPYVARIPYGLGCVTWVAQDLGDRRLNNSPDPWPYLWDKIFGWTNDTHTRDDVIEDDQKIYSENLAGTGPVDLGLSQLHGVEFPGKSAGLITLAVVFFIVYWIIAGPGTYLFLAGRKQREHSWTAFGFVALGATVLTVLVVRLVLRGSPQIQHASDVRIVTGQAPQPGIVYSRVGLYIPRDGEQQVSLADTSDSFVSFLTPMSLHPSYVPDNEFPANLDYSVAVHDVGTSYMPSIAVPFRSTLKKLETKWCGDMGIKVRANSVKLDLSRGAMDNSLSGSIDNLSGVDLRNVFIAFHHATSPVDEDYVLYVPRWDSQPPANRIDLGRLCSDAKWLATADGQGGALPERGERCKGGMHMQWEPYWYARLRAREPDDIGSKVPVSFPVLSFFDRLRPPRNPPPNDRTSNSEAFTVLRRGMRNLNMSAALESGELVVLAEADNRPLPCPLDVNGRQVEGDGTVFYQFALPIERFEPPPPTTAPAEK